MAKTDKELADELDSNDRLRERGYEMKGCKRCHGMGSIAVHEPRFMSVPCPACEGRGFHWQAPLTK